MGGASSSRQARGIRLFGRASSASGAWCVFPKAGYSPVSSELWSIHSSPSGARSTLSLEGGTSELRQGDPLIPDSEPGVAIGDEIVPVRLSVRGHAVWIFGSVYPVGRS